MILPIYVQGADVLRKAGQDITSEYPNLSVLIANMFDTMYEADGIGLAAPQIGKSINLFVLDLSQFEGDDEMPNNNTDLTTKIFINPKIIATGEKLCPFKEGCLSVPGINEIVERPDEITIEYLDENMAKHTDTFTGMWSRAIQHEYEHLQGNLFVDSVAQIRKQMIASKLNAMTKGKYKAHYKTR